MADATKSLGGHLFENMQRARKELRHQAHIYANTKKKDKIFRDQAGENLEKAAIAMALSAALHGIYADCARPAGADGLDWLRHMDPESALELEAMAKKKGHRARRRRTA